MNEDNTPTNVERAILFLRGEKPELAQAIQDRILEDAEEITRLQRKLDIDPGHLEIRRGSEVSDKTVWEAGQSLLREVEKNHRCQEHAKGFKETAPGGGCIQVCAVCDKLLGF